MNVVRSSPLGPGVKGGEGLEGYRLSFGYGRGMVRGTEREGEGRRGKERDGCHWLGRAGGGWGGLSLSRFWHHLG